MMDSRIRVAIADDEPLALMRLARLLDRAGCEVQAQFQDGMAMVDWLKGHPLPDCLFLDVKMPGATGLDILAEYAERLPIVLVTSNSEFAVSAFDFAAADFLLKPVEEARLAKTLDRLRHRLLGRGAQPRPMAPSKIPVTAGSGTVLLELAKISHFEIEGGKVFVCGVQGRFLSRWRSLAQAEAALPGVPLVRLNRTIMARTESVRGLRVLPYGRRMVLLADGREYSASRKGSQDLATRLGL
ncbi:MAG: DNA-binding response regulator [Holophagaceae bacterium]|nr:DNA-binding response regulator [Holophagaceae bacterium]